jgi:hypothetical protein
MATSLMNWLLLGYQGESYEALTHRRYPRRLEIINELARHVRADAVIHAGDFGFFDHGSFERLSDREIKLHVAHSDLLQTKKNQILALSRNKLIEAVREHRLLGGFQAYPR